MTENAYVASRLHFEDALPGQTNPPLVQHSVGQAASEKLLGFTAGLFGDLHWGLGRDLTSSLFGQATLVVRREDFAGNGGGSLNDQPTHLTLKFREHPGMVCR